MIAAARDLLATLLLPQTLVGLWFFSLLLTLAVEVPLYVLLSRGAVRCARAALAGAAGTLLTHPALWFFWPRLVDSDYTTYLVSGELAVVAAEALTFLALARPVGAWRALACSLVANGASCGVGALLWRFVLG
ncbi:MAG: hypothetical protein FJ125_11830 [Deltaproteobacteria bacterium]|nr:hypothetical protein [Deltaproteobacteria bacterium]